MRPRHPRAMPPGAIALSALALALVVCRGGAAAAAPDPGRRPPVPAQAGWLFQAQDSPPVQSAPLLAALRFPPGTTYRAALTALVRSVAATGTLPTTAVVVGHLPRGVVWAPSRTGPRLGLTAPASYAIPRGVIFTPTFTFPPSVSPQQAMRIVRDLNAGRRIGAAAKALGVGVPRLAPCQRLPRKRPCRLAPRGA